MSCQHIEKHLGHLVCCVTLLLRYKFTPGRGHEKFRKIPCHLSTFRFPMLLSLNRMDTDILVLQCFLEKITGQLSTITIVSTWRNIELS